MRLSTASILSVLLAGAPALVAQQTAAPPKDVTAVRANSRAPHLDGRLDDAVWTEAQPATDFILREPTEGVPAPERTEVRFAFTDDALYVGARMFSNAPAAIRRMVARRDREPPSERLIISLDSRADRRTAYSFGITPGGVRIDYFHGSDFEDSRDYSYDPVWEAVTRVDSLGWVAEIRIPFAQLRFNPGPRQVWGVNLVRLVPDRNEEAFWILVGRNETGWSSRMGRLLGIADLPAARRVEVLPYVAANATRFGEVQAGPLGERYATGARGGGDLKVGLGPNMTLEATFNPDFGQVEADPAVVNLTAFETFYDERRPFFLEGSDLLGGRGTFYSRRIGAPPPISGGQYAETADNSTILGAAKVTGRLPSGLALGALTAVTDRERVTVYDSAGNRLPDLEVAPFTAYGILTARQEIGRNRSTLAASFTAVERDLDPNGRLAVTVPRRAYTGLVDGRLRWAGGRYDMSAYVGVSYVAGDSLAIQRQQLSSRRYFQRPDSRYQRFHPHRTSLTGITTGINHSKLAGAWRWDIDYAEERPQLELNDIGALGSADDRGLFWDVYYRQTKPGKMLHSWTSGFFQGNEWNFDGDRKFTEFGLWWDGVMRGSFLRPSIQISSRLRALSDDETRGGPLMATPFNWSLDLALRSNRNARTAWDLEATYARNAIGGRVIEFEASTSARPGVQWEVSAEARYRRETVARQYVLTDTIGPAATYGQGYIFSYIERSEWVLQLRAALAVRPELTIEAYVEPFASSGLWRDFGRLVAARSIMLEPFDPGIRAPEDFEIQSLRSNLVIRWEWRPGSTLFLVWQQDRGRDAAPDGNVGPGGIFRAFGSPGNHFLTIKASYWIPVH
jgi:hypothetical protein